MTCDTTNKENLMNFMDMLLTSSLKLHKSIMVLDNHRAHTSKDFVEMAKEHGLELLYLPPYSPELNPIEKLWSQVKL